MKKVAALAKILRYATIILVIPAEILVHVGGWWQGMYFVYGSSSKYWCGCCFYRGDFPYKNLPGCDVIKTETLPWFGKFLCIAIDAVSLTIVLLGLRYFIKLLERFEQGEVFSVETLQLLKKISLCGLLWAVYQMLYAPLAGIVDLIFNYPSFISVHIGTDDIFNLAFVGMLFFIMYALNEAYALKQEHDLTV